MIFFYTYVRYLFARYNFTYKTIDESEIHKNHSIEKFKSVRFYLKHGCENMKDLLNDLFPKRKQFGKEHHKYSKKMRNSNGDYFSVWLRSVSNLEEINRIFSHNGIVVYRIIA